MVKFLFDFKELNVNDLAGAFTASSCCVECIISLFNTTTHVKEVLQAVIQLLHSLLALSTTSTTTATSLALMMVFIRTGKLIRLNTCEIGNFFVIEPTSSPTQPFTLPVIQLSSNSLPEVVSLINDLSSPTPSPIGHTLSLEHATMLANRVGDILNRTDSDLVRVYDLLHINEYKESLILGDPCDIVSALQAGSITQAISHRWQSAFFDCVCYFL